MSQHVLLIPPTFIGRVFVSLLKCLNPQLYSQKDCPIKKVKHNA